MIDSDDITRQLAARDRLRKALARNETPAERMAAMARLQEATWEILRQSPEGYAHFLRRNFKKRSVRWPPQAAGGPDAT